MTETVRLAWQKLERAGDGESPAQVAHVRKIPPELRTERRVSCGR